MTKQVATIVIPEDLDFSQLNLNRDPDGSISFDLAVIERVCQASNLPSQVFLNAPEDNVAGLIMYWYRAHRAEGGAKDLVAEDLIAEVLAEENAGQSSSFPPGRA